MQSRRDQLKGITDSHATHAGLWFDKFLEKQLPKGAPVPPDESTPQQRLIEACANIAEPAHYQQFFVRWKATLEAYGVTKFREAEVQGRMVVGLGDESVVETAVALHHTYGLPYIPGSALKGVAAAYAHKRLDGDTWRKGGEAHQVVFGDTAEAGFITFFDALYVPGSGKNGRALHPDVITVHHQDYYDGKSAPTDWDNPNPVSFMSATGKYFIALSGPNSEWVDTTFQILGQALIELGVGAKTSSGYGRLKFADWDGIAAAPSTKVEAALTPDQQAVQHFKQRLDALPNNRVANEINGFVEQWRQLDLNEVHVQEVARAILIKVRDAKREKKSKDKPWYQELVASLPAGSWQ
jgi:CRISPR-associated protein Cmr6